jgi:hypothetical protein
MLQTTSKLIESDTLLPEQFFAGKNGDDGASNERQLMLAILRDAVECFQRFALARDAQGRETFDEADEWIFSPERVWPFSFENICDVLGIEAAYVRSGLAPLRSTEIRRTRRAPKIVTLADRRSDDAWVDELISLPQAS